MNRDLVRLGLIIAVVVSLTPPRASAHETDHFAIPPGRDFADLGDYLTGFFYDRIERGVVQLNHAIRQAPDQAAAARFYTRRAVADAVNDALPDAYNAIETLDSVVRTPQMAQRYPGRVAGYKNRANPSYSHMPFDLRAVFKIWFAAHFKAYGVYIGCDKVGHFSDMGKHYFDIYDDALDDGKSPQEAYAQIIRFATEDPVFSEAGVLGYLSAGAYSNGDLASNFCGFLFYRNLTEPVKLKGVVRPPMLVRDGKYWKLADHVRRDSDFFSWFVSEHWDEALNPSHYDKLMRPGMRDSIRERAPVILWRYRDEHDCLRAPRYFRQLAIELRTYYGENYGQDGDFDELISLDIGCFQPPDKGKAVDALGYAALHMAVLRGDVAGVKKLLDGGAAVDTPVAAVKPFSTELGSTPLHLAAADGNIEMVRLLLDRGANVTTRSARLITPLHRAVASPAVARLLIERGADLNAADDAGQTPLHWAAADAHGADTLALLLDRHAGTPADHLGRTPLHHAARAGRDQAVTALARAGAPVNAADQYGTTALHLAAQAGHPQAVQSLLSAGANPDAADEFGYTPLHLAAANGRADVLAPLLAHGAKVAIADETGVTPLHLACRARHADAAAALLKAGADPNAATSAGLTPLHEAAMSGDAPLAQALVAHGAQLDLRTSAGLTPAQAAGARGHHDVATALSDGGNHVYASPRGTEDKP